MAQTNTVSVSQDNTKVISTQQPDQNLIRMPKWFKLRISGIISGILTYYISCLSTSNTKWFVDASYVLLAKECPIQGICWPSCLIRQPAATNKSVDGKCCCKLSQECLQKLLSQAVEVLIVSGLFLHINTFVLLISFKASDEFVKLFILNDWH